MNNPPASWRLGRRKHKQCSGRRYAVHQTDQERAPAKPMRVRCNGVHRGLAGMAVSLDMAVAMKMRAVGQASGMAGPSAIAMPAIGDQSRPYIVASAPARFS
jgi:hypothetical protein